MVGRCLDCSTTIYQQLHACPKCGGVIADTTQEKKLDRSRFHQRRKFCVDCKHYGKHQRGNQEKEGCGQMLKPCDVEAAWLTNRSKWCPIGREIEFAEIYPFSTAYPPSVVPPESWHHSLKPINDYAVVTVATGKRSMEIAEYTVPQMERYANKCGADMVVLTDDQFPNYRIGNKFRLADVGRMYDRVLFLDMDVWIAIDTPNLFKLRRDRIWAHPDRKYLSGFSFFDADCGMWRDTQGVSIPPNMEIYNTGVVLFSNGQSQIWEKPSKPFFDTHTAEQTLVEIQARNAGFKFASLPLRYNLQWWMKEKWGRTDAFIHHLANCPHQERLEWLRRRTSAGVPLGA